MYIKRRMLLILGFFSVYVPSIETMESSTQEEKAIQTVSLITLLAKRPSFKDTQQFENALIMPVIHIEKGHKESAIAHACYEANSVTVLSDYFFSNTNDSIALDIRPRLQCDFLKEWRGLPTGRIKGGISDYPINLTCLQLFKLGYLLRRIHAVVDECKKSAGTSVERWKYFIKECIRSENDMQEYIESVSSFTLAEQEFYKALANYSLDGEKGNKTDEVREQNKKELKEAFLEYLQAIESYEETRDISPQSGLYYELPSITALCLVQ